MTIGDTIAALSAFVALVALFRPEIGNLLRRWRNQIELFPLQRTEIGFSNFGPTIGIVGTLRASNGDQFVHNMSATVIRRKDNLTHQFSWAVFRPFTVQFDVKDAQYASGFGIKQDEARPLNVQLFDQETRTAIETPLTQMRDEWLAFLTAQGKDTTALSQTDAKALFDSGFQKAKPNYQGAIYGDITRHFYWEPGDYVLKVEIWTWDPVKKFTKSFKFALTAEESRILQLNCITAMYNICGIPAEQYNFVHPLLSIA